MDINRKATRMKFQNTQCVGSLFSRHVWACHFLLGTYATATLMQSTVYAVYIRLPIINNDFLYFIGLLTYWSSSHSVCKLISSFCFHTVRGKRDDLNYKWVPKVHLQTSMKYENIAFHGMPSTFHHMPSITSPHHWLEHIFMCSMPEFR